MKGGRENMKIASIVIAMLMITSMITVGVLAETEGAPEVGEHSITEVERIIPVTARAIQEGIGTVSSVEAVEAVPIPAGFGDVEEVITEVEGIIPEAKRIGFVKAFFAKGFLIDEDSNHLALVEGIWAKVTVTTSESARDSRIVATGRLKIDNEVYKLVKQDITENSIEFRIVDPEGKSQGMLSLELVDSFDEDNRKLWSGKIEMGEMEGDVTLATIERSVRRSSEKEMQEVPIGRFEEKTFDVDSESQARLTEDIATKAESDNQGGLVAWLRRTFG